jgi:hypothetical protein
MYLCGRTPRLHTTTVDNSIELPPGENYLIRTVCAYPVSRTKYSSFRRRRARFLYTFRSCPWLAVARTTVNHYVPRFAEIRSTAVGCYKNIFFSDRHRVSWVAHHVPCTGHFLPSDKSLGVKYLSYRNDCCSQNLRPRIIFNGFRRALLRRHICVHRSTRPRRSLVRHYG